MTPWLVPLVLIAAASLSATQDPTQNSFLRRFDTNGDGKIDDNERRAVRQKMQEIRNRPDARKPSGKTETVDGRLVTELAFTSSDGRTIPCVLSMPQGEGPFPILVTIHGGQGDRDMTFLRSNAAPNPESPTINAFNRKPWGVLAIGYRSGNGALFGKEVDDVLAGIRFAKTVPKADPGRIGVVGGSHGGHLALSAAKQLGTEIVGVAVGSPWMVDPVAEMLGDPGKPPLSLVRKEARDELVRNANRIFSGLVRARGMTEDEAKKFIQSQSIAASADKIQAPTLFITSRGDDQAPHVMIESTIERMRKAGRDVTVYTAQKSPHGFYWARTVGAARALRGEKTAVEAAEEETARQTMLDFFEKHFTRKASGPARNRATTAPNWPGVAWWW